MNIHSYLIHTENYMKPFFKWYTWYINVVASYTIIGIHIKTHSIFSRM